MIMLNEFQSQCPILDAIEKSIKGNTKFKIVFEDINYETNCESTETFDTPKEAEDFIESIRCEGIMDIVIDDDGNDAWKQMPDTFYYNKESHHGYTIKPIIKC